MKSAKVSIFIPSTVRFLVLVAQWLLLRHRRHSPAKELEPAKIVTGKTHDALAVTQLR
jgi:hypothetical protein